MGCVENANKDTGLASFYLPGGIKVISLLKAEHVKKALLGNVYRQGISFLDQHMKMFLGQKSLVQMMGDEWKFHRKLISASFHHEYLKEMVGDMAFVAKKFCSTLSKEIANSKDKEIALDIFP